MGEIEKQKVKESLEKNKVWLNKTTNRGQITECVILAELVKRGIVVLQPVGYAHRYDYVLDINSKFVKIQCKTGRITNSTICFNTCSQSNVTHKRKNYRGEVDYFAVYEPFSEKIYLIEPEKVGVATGHLRLKPSKNGIKLKANMAEDFELDGVLGKILNSE